MLNVWVLEIGSWELATQRWSSAFAKATADRPYRNSPFAFLKTAVIIAGVNLPVFVFCRLG